MQRIKPGVNPIGTLHKVDMPGFGEVRYRVFSIQESGPGQPDLTDPMVVCVYADVKRLWYPQKTLAINLQAFKNLFVPVTPTDDFLVADKIYKA
jgi:hypothetical protein